MCVGIRKRWTERDLPDTRKRDGDGDGGGWVGGWIGWQAQEKKMRNCRRFRYHIRISSTLCLCRRSECERERERTTAAWYRDIKCRPRPRGHTSVLYSSVQCSAVNDHRRKHTSESSCCCRCSSSYCVHQQTRLLINLNSPSPTLLFASWIKDLLGLATCSFHFVLLSLSCAVLCSTAALYPTTRS